MEQDQVLKRQMYEAAGVLEIRAEGPAIYLAQPEGLGGEVKNVLRAEGTTVCNPKTAPGHQTVEPLTLFPLRNWAPALQAGQGKRTGRCPINQNSATSKGAKAPTVEPADEADSRTDSKVTTK